MRTTEIRVAPEVGGQLAAIKVEGRARARRRRRRRAVGDRADRVGRAGARAARRCESLARQRLCRRSRRAGGLARGRDRESESAARLYASAIDARPARSRAPTTPRSRRSTRPRTTWRTRAPTLAEAEANHEAAVAGPTREERAIADAEVEAAASALAVLERRLDKTILRAPADGVVSVIVAEIGENVRAGQPVLVIAEAGKQFLSFNAREDLLHGLTVGSTVNVRRSGAAEKTPALVTELRPLGTFATWQAERAVGDHDRNTLRLRLDLQGDPTGFEPGMSVWLDP